MAVTPEQVTSPYNKTPQCVPDTETAGLPGRGLGSELHHSSPSNLIIREGFGTPTRALTDADLSVCCLPAGLQAPQTEPAGLDAPHRGPL